MIRSFVKLLNWKEPPNGMDDHHNNKVVLHSQLSMCLGETLNRKFQQFRSGDMLPNQSRPHTLLTPHQMPVNKIDQDLVPVDLTAAKDQGILNLNQSLQYPVIHVMVVLMDASSMDFVELIVILVGTQKLPIHMRLQFSFY